MVESVDTRDLKSLAPEGACGFKSRFEYKAFPHNLRIMRFFVYTVSLRRRNNEFKDILGGPAR